MDTNASSPKTSAANNNADLLAVALSVSAVIWAAAAGTAQAQTQPALPRAEAVSIADLDLSTADGARVLLKRLDIAAQRACGGEPVKSPLFPREPGLFEKCVKEAISTAVRQADQPMLAAIHEEQSLSGGMTLASR